MKQSIIVVLIVVCLLGGIVGGYGVGYTIYEPKIKNYENQVSMLTSEVSRLNSTISSQQTQISTLQTELINDQAKISNYEKQISSLELEKSKLQLNLTEAQKTITDYETQVSNYKTQVSNYEAQVSSLQSQIAEVESERNQLKTELTNAQKTISNYESQISTLQSQTTGSQAQIATLQSQISTLQNQLSTLQAQYDTLQVKYVAAQNSLTASQSLSIGTTLETYYDYVRANCVTFGLEPVGEERWSSYPNYYKLSVSFAADLSAHDIGNAWWRTLDEGCGYYNFTDEYSYQTSSRIMKQAFALAGISSSDSDATKIEKVLAFINSDVHYESRLLDHMWFPCETLTFRSGDCTSFSILAAAMFEEAGIKSAIGFFNNQTMPEGRQHHAMVLVHLDNLGSHGYRYYPDLTGYGLTSGKWIIIEPQYASLEEQDTNLNWISYWNIVASAEVPYGP